MYTQEKTTAAVSLSVSAENVYAQTFWIMLFAGLTALGARFEILHYPVPFTLQTMFVLLSGAFLGKRNGALSQALYLGVGAIGLPVFAMGGAVGIFRFLGPTGGYLLAFPVAAFVIGYLLEKRNNFMWILASMAAGLLIIFAAGTVHLHFVVVRDWAQAFSAGFLIFSWWDMVKLLAAASIYHQFVRRTS
jgi:biotin transport system substrate-specific component